MVLGGAYSLWLANRILFGNINLSAISVSPDLTQREMATLVPLVFLVLLMGLFPNIFLEVMHSSVSNLLQNMRLLLYLLL
jgi:NADH:ubiquinone oxidoreductase subunit 4 (subunit M)